MFTGLVQAVGEVAGVQSHSQGIALQIHFRGWDHTPSVGDSISIAGVCLTVTRIEQDGLASFDVIPESIARTTLSGLAPGDKVNLEHASRVDTLFGGHIVQGHVDGVGKVRSINKADGEWRVDIAPPIELMPLIAPKGSITIDGVSLTVACVNADSFDVALIPVTLECTTLGKLKTDDQSNIETDVIARQVAHYLEAMHNQ